MAGRIEDYALVGDTQSAGLVCRDGAVDWPCVPRFDSEACFAALLGDARQRPLADRAAGKRRQGRPAPVPDGQLILETEISTSHEAPSA